MPDQDQFMNLMVEPTDVGHQSCSWESSKRIKTNTPSKISDTAEMDSCEPSTRVPADLDSCSPLAEDFSDANCEIIVFMLGAVKVHDPSQPLPAPSRFVRKGK